MDVNEYSDQLRIRKYAGFSVSASQGTPPNQLSSNKFVAENTVLAVVVMRHEDEEQDTEEWLQPGDHEPWPLFEWVRLPVPS